MNRSQRRAGIKLNPAAESALAVLARGAEQHQRGELGPAAHLYKKAIALDSSLAAAHERLALISLTQGKLAKAAVQYTDHARARPQVLTQFGRIFDTLKKLLPALAAALAEGRDGSVPMVSAAAEPDTTTTIAGNPYFRFVLAATVMRDRALESWLTTLRADILAHALSDQAADDDVVAFCGALAQQCFNNEYVFNVTPDENEKLDRLTAIVASVIARRAPAGPLQLAALAMYRPLHRLPDAGVLTELALPAPLVAVVTQQVREPQQEEAMRASFPRLTEIGEGVTAEVRQQYEENPYPRWVLMAQPPAKLMVIDDHIRHQFPTMPFRPTGAREEVDILVAGCGTGRSALEFAQSFRGARVVGFDLSLSSLTHAKRKIPEAVAAKVEFAQGDILKIGSLDRRFDVISCTGVLHHMDDALGGWRELIKLMKPNGFMHIGLYSVHARKEIVAARQLIKERGYASTPEGIRQCRQDLLSAPEPFKFMGLRDFYSTSECRDLMFHVHERQFTIPEIKEFLAANDLKFIGFEFGQQDVHLQHREAFARAGWSTGDLDRWDEYERANPDLFATMYLFWLQKNNP